MKDKIKQLFIMVGVLLGLSVALIPMTTYAEAEYSTASASAQVEVVPAIALRIEINDHQNTEDSGILFESPLLNEVNEATFTAVVSSNQAYGLSLNALGGQTDMLPDGVSSAEAPVNGKIPGSGEIAVGNTSWGVKLSSAADYVAVPATITEFSEGEAAQEAETEFSIGLVTNVSLLSGAYSSTLVVTAATK